ncbi:FecR domain-containing protein, partial [bacterium]|nr:FecR domain-containing protein [bacterium]
DQSFHGLSGDGSSSDPTQHQMGGGEFPLKLEVSGGVVHVRNSNGFQIIKNGEIHSLAFLDEVRTGAKATASIVYPEDKVRLRLKSRTRIQIARNSLRLFHGSSWVHIVRKGTKFEVKTPNLIAAVRGTVFSVDVEGDSVSTGTRGPLATLSVVSVFEGRVEVRSLTSNQPSVFVNPSQEVKSKGLILTGVSELEQDARDRWSEALKELDLPAGREGHPNTNTLPKNSEVRPDESFSDELDR